MNTEPAPKRGEIWYVRFDPGFGAEIKKIRPAVVISEDIIGVLPLRIVVPVTDWKPAHRFRPWFTELKKTRSNGLSKDSGADGFQVKSLSVARFERRIGKVTANQLDNIADSVAVCIGCK